MSLIRCLCTITVVALFLMGTSALGATLELDPTEGSVGNTVLASGTGYTPDFVVTLDLDGSTNVASVRVPAGGAFSVEFQVPVKLAGDYTVTATELVSEIQATAAFRIVAYPPELTEVNPSDVAAGSLVTLSGRGFGSSEAIEVDFGTTANIANGTSNADGEFALTFAVDLQPEGTKTVTARGVTTGLSASATMELYVEVSIPDPNLEAALRSTLKGDFLTPPNLASITSFGVIGRGISNLTGIEYLTNLEWLQLHYNQISDITPLAGLVNISYLYLHNNQISDITPLAGLVNISYLVLMYNQINDISVLEGLTSIKKLSIYGNQVTNLLPLVTNPGVGDGVELFLGANPLDDISLNTYIPVLENLGALVSLEHELPVALASFTGCAGADGVELHWSTASEMANLGFDVYRSDYEDGPYTKVNPELIKGAGTDATSHDYTFIDEEAVPGKTYYYAIEDIDFSGASERHASIEVVYERQIMSGAWSRWVCLH